MSIYTFENDNVQCKKKKTFILRFVEDYMHHLTILIASVRH